MDDLEKSRSASLNFLFLLSTFVLVVLQIKEKKNPQTLIRSTTHTSHMSSRRIVEKNNVVNHQCADLHVLYKLL